MAGLDYAHRRLVNTLGPERVARGEHERMVYSHDFASLPKIALIQWRLYPDFVVLPRTTPEVAAIVKLSDETGLPITPRGGGTGSVGAAVPNRGGVLLDLRSMNRIVSLDPSARTVTSEAGVTWRASPSRSSPTRLPQARSGERSTEELRAPDPSVTGPSGVPYSTSRWSFPTDPSCGRGRRWTSAAHLRT